MNYKTLKPVSEVKPRNKNMTISMVLLFLFLLGLLLIGLATCSPDKIFVGNLEGTIFDTDGTSPLSNVTLICTSFQNSDTYNTFQTTTDSRGNYKFENIPYGIYIINAKSTEGYGALMQVEISEYRNKKDGVIEATGCIYGDVIIKGAPVVAENNITSKSYISMEINKSGQVVTLTREVDPADDLNNLSYFFDNVPLGNHKIITKIDGIGIKQTNAAITEKKIKNMTITLNQS
ncbi:MAG: carboxypeptidase-like regulatory domain-containing protein [Vulcanimicrobiota bacterium]